MTPWTAAHQASLSIINSQSPPKPMYIESVMPSNHLILCRPLLLLPSIFPSIRGFSTKSALHIRWPKYWSFTLNISPSNEHPGLISFRMDWLDLLAVQGALKSLLQHHSSKASIFWHSAFFTVQLSHPYMTTGQTIALTRQTLIGKVMSLLFNIQEQKSYKILWYFLDPSLPLLWEFTVIWVSLLWGFWLFLSLYVSCQLQIGTCHLPLWGLNDKLLQQLTFNIPQKRVQVGEQKWGSLY